MDIRDIECVEQFVATCTDGWKLGWHESNGGNLSLLLDERDVASCRTWLSEDGAWHPLRGTFSHLAGAHLLVTGAGRHFRTVARDLERSCGIVQISNAGDAWRIAWGLAGGRPTSELHAHLLAYETRTRMGVPARAFYHTHAPNVIALSAVIDSDARTWSRELWQIMTECIVMFPHGIGCAGWILPGSEELARATADELAAFDACVWALHGLAACAPSLDEAVGLTHTIEKAAGIALAARAARASGQPATVVTPHQLREVCRSFGITPNEAFLGD